LKGKEEGRRAEETEEKKKRLSMVVLRLNEKKITHFLNC
jgi:hypothetical protein